MNAVPSVASDRTGHGIDAAVQLLTFEPGLYSASFAVGQSLRGDIGLRLPCVRIDALAPGSASPGHVQVAVLTETGFLSGPADLGFVRVQGARASVMVTTYTPTHTLAGGSVAPELKFTLIERSTTAAPDSDTRPQMALPNVVVESKLPGVTVLVHVAAVGDIVVAPGQWAGRIGSGLAIEAMRIDGGPVIPPADIEYQAVLGWNWNTPWFPGGALCGSRGIALPLLGLRVRLLGASASIYSVVYEARLVDGQSIGPFSDGEACVEGTLPLEAIRIDFMPLSA